MKRKLWPVLVALTFSPVGGVLAQEADCESCRVSLQRLDLSQAPSDGELVLSGQLGGALSPTATKKDSSPEDRLLFGRAMEAWNQHDYRTAVPLFKRHIGAYVDSPWRGEAELHLGCEARFNGRYAEAEGYFRKILKDHGGWADSGDDIACKARLRLAMLEFMRGDFDKAEALWSEMVIGDQDRMRRDHARHWLMRASLYRSEAKWVRRCAVESVACLLRTVGRKAEAESLWNVPANADYGFSADELAALSSARGLPLVGLCAESVSELPIPFIAHYRFNHFVTVTGRGPDGSLEVFDSILNHAVTMTPAQFAVEWSGLALVPAKAWQASRSATAYPMLAANELRSFVGGCCGVENPNRDKGCNTGNKMGGNLNLGQIGIGMPVWAFTPISMNLFVKDTPIGYQPAVGPGIAFTMAYNSIDSDVNLTSFGPKWFFAYHCRAIETPASSNGSVTVYMQDGRDDVYSPVQGSTNAYTSPARVFNKLVKVTTNRYTMETPEGTVYTFGAPQGATNTSQALLSKITDRHSNTVTLVYDGQPNPKLSSVVDALSQTSRIYYAGSGLITNIVDPFGRKASFTYTNGYLKAATDMGGVTSDYEFYQVGATNGYMKSLRTSAGKVAFAYVFQQPGGGNVWRRQQITARYENGTTEVLYYNGGEDGNPSTFFTDRNGHTTRFKLGLNSVFPNQGKVVYQEAPDGNRVSYLYNAGLQPTNVTDEAGQVWSFAYNNLGRPTSFLEPGGYRASFAYTNGDADLASVTEGTNLLMTLAYTTNRDVSAVTNALSQSAQFRYDSVGRVTNVVDALGIVNTLDYGNDGRLATVKRDGAVLATWQYDAIGRATNAMGPDGMAIGAAFDGLNRLTALTLPGQSPYQWTYQTNSLLLSRFTDRSGRRTSLAYDTLNRLVSVQAPDFSHTAFEYDANDNLQTLIDAEVHRTRFAYDSRDRLTTKTYPGGKSNQVAWTARSLPATFTSPRGITTAYGFSPAGLLTNVAYAGTTNTSGLQFSYDSLNRVTNAVDGWATNVFVCDVLGRVVQAKEIQGTFTQTFAYAYDAIGRTTNVTWQAGTNEVLSTTYGYDSLNRITNLTSDAGTFGYSYLSNGLRVATLAYPNGETANYGLDELRRMTNLLYKTSGGVSDGQWAYQYNDRDQVVSRIDPTGNGYAYEYDRAGRLTEATASTNVTGYPFRYTHDWASNRTRQTEGTRTRQFVANDDNQLVSVGRSNEVSVIGYVNKPGTNTVVQVTSSSMTNWLRVPTRYVATNQAWFEAYGVTVTNAGTNNTIWIKATDKVGNSTTQTVHVSSSSTNLVFGYDADGNQTNGSAGTYTWDAENRLIAITYADNAQTRLRYDGAGRMREMAEFNPAGVATNTLRYAWNGWLPIAELDGENRILRTFTWGLDVSGSFGGAGGIGGLVGIRDSTGSGTNYFARSDGKGNVTEVRTSAGTVVAAYTYAPFGGLLTSSGTYDQPFRFQSKMWHAKSGLGYWGLRWFDPITAKWISRDGLGEAGGLNLYEYCGGDPLDHLDALGEFQAIASYNWWTDVASGGYQKGGFLGGLQADTGNTMGMFIDFWAARTLEKNATLSGQFAGTPGCSGEAWSYGGLAGGQILLSAASAFGGNNAVHPWIRYIGPRSLGTYGAAGRVLSGTWVTRGPAFGRNFTRAADALQLPNMPNDVIRVQGAWRQYIRYERRATGFPKLGTGGAPQWQVP